MLLFEPMYCTLCTVASGISGYLFHLRNPLHVVHSVALLVLVAIATFQRSRFTELYNASCGVLATLGIGSKRVRDGM